MFDRVVYVLVDGARGTLPIGGGDVGLRVSSWQLDVARLLHGLKGSGFGAFDDFFGRVQFEVTE